MKFSHLSLLFLISTLTVWAKWPDSAKPFASAAMVAKSGSKVSGTVDFAQSKNKLLVRAYLSNLSPGSHGFHLHTSGDCSAPDASSAGDHYNPTGAKHGAPTTVTRHAGDLGNVTADASGNARVEVSIATPSEKIFPGWTDIVGKSVVLHEKNDDMKTDPSGNSGTRISCGTVVVVPPSGGAG